MKLPSKPMTVSTPDIQTSEHNRSANGAIVPTDIQALIEEADRQVGHITDKSKREQLIADLAAALSALSGETETDVEYGVLGTFVADGKFWDAWPVASIEAGNAEISAMEPEPTDDTAVNWRVVQRTPEVKVKPGPWIEVV